MGRAASWVFRSTMLGMAVPSFLQQAPVARATTGPARFRASLHTVEDLEHVRVTYGLSGVGTVRYGLLWLWQWWLESGPDGVCYTRSDGHVPIVGLRPGVTAVTAGSEDRWWELPVDDTDVMVAVTLADVADTVVEDLYRHAICVARTVLDGGFGAARPLLSEQEAASA